MLKNSMGAACATVLVALAGGLAIPTASHAAIYGGVFDPENANYKWGGNHVFSIDNACLVGDGWKRVNAIGYGGCGSASLTGGDLTVVNKRGTTSLDDDVSKTLQFSSFPAFIPNTIDVWGVNIVGGELVGIDTFKIGDFTFDNPGTTHAGDWQLRWTSGQGLYCTLYGLICEPTPAGRNTANGAAVFLTNTILGDPNSSVSDTGPARNVTFQRIPEPTTVTLVLAALAAGVLSRRRRR